MTETSEVQKNVKEKIKRGNSEYRGRMFVDCRVYYDCLPAFFSVRFCSRSTTTSRKESTGILRKRVHVVIPSLTRNPSGWRRDPGSFLEGRCNPP
jgi:hypothetical protein